VLEFQFAMPRRGAEVAEDVLDGACNADCRAGPRPAPC
jgi:hypothetical protein